MQTVIKPRPLNPILSTLDDMIIEVTLTEKPVLLPINYRYGIVVDFVPFDEYEYGGVVRPSDGSHKVLGAYLVNYIDATQTLVVGQNNGSHGNLAAKQVSEAYIIPEHNCIHHAHERLLNRLMSDYLKFVEA